MLDISLKQMRYAVEIAQCGSINQAAQNLYVTQSSLSKAMKELESVLGYAVFRRTPAGTAVTEEGQSFLELARQIVYKLEVLERQLQSRNERLAAMKISILCLYRIFQRHSEPGADSDQFLRDQFPGGR